MIPTKRILVVDDDASTREIVSLCLQKFGGWQIVTAASGQVALAIATTTAIDAIVLDVMLPGMDGIAFLQHLRGLPKTAKIPVVVLTAHAYILETGLLPLLSIQTVIKKPFESKAIADQVANALGWTTLPAQ